MNTNGSTNVNPGGSLEKALLSEALRKTSQTERAAYLDGACRNDPALRARLELLLEGHFKAKGFLETAAAQVREARPPPSVLPTAAPVSGAAVEGAAELPRTPVSRGAALEYPGDRIGRYKLLQRVGEGGCGVVYMAEQMFTFLQQVIIH